MDTSESPAESIFFEAMARGSPALRARYIEEACVGDAALRARVERLLAAHPRVGSFLESPAAADLTDVRDGRAPLAAATGEGPGTVIGPYKLLDLIGEGGFGSVFLAEQSHPVRRKVALKIVKPGMDSRQVVARFEAERQALAVMDHPNIAKVFDAGTTDSGRPYFVMELVKGVPITKFCDERRLPPRQRLELFVHVCHAVQHAHQKGIIHRDLKPSNVLVALYDERAVPKVIDFGVAKALGATLTDRTMFTGVGAIVGTLEYMPPEQAQLNQLDVDTRSDVYSLGVMLYELLTGSTPIGAPRMKRAALEEVLRIIRQEDPPKPSTRLSTTDGLASIAANRGLEPRQLNGLVRGELDWIVMKALEKDRERRYETANGFARDVERYLHDEAVEACPPSAWYRGRKFARRHKVALASGLALSLVVLLAVAGLVVNNRMVTREKDQKEVALAHALQEKQRADQNLVRARKAVNKYLALAANNELLKEADFHELRRSLLESAIPFYEEFVAQKHDDAELESERGRALGDLAIVREDLGDLDQALAAHVQRRDLFARLAASPAATPAHRHELANSYRNLGNVLLAKNEHPKAEAAFREAAKTLEALLAQYPSEAPYREDLSGAYSNLGILLRRLDRHEESLDAQQRAVAITERLVTDFPLEPKYRRDLAGSLLNLSSVFSNVGRFENAVAAITRAADLLKKLAEDEPGNALYREMWGTALDNQAVLLCELGRPEEGLVAHQQAVRIHESLAANFKSVPGYRQGLAISLMNLSILQAELGRFDDGLATCAKAIEILERLVTESPDVAANQQGLALTYRSQGDLHGRLNQHERALGAFGKALVIQEKLVKASPAVPRLREELSLTYNAMGEALSRLGRYDESAAAYEKALPIREELARAAPTVVVYPAQLAATYGAIGYLKLQQHKPAEALEWCDKALAKLDPVLAAEPKLAMARAYASRIYLSRASAFGELARHAEALQDLDRALTLDDGEIRTALRLARAKTMAHLDSPAQAVADADAVIAQTPDPPADVLHGAATVYAVCAAGVRGEPAVFERYAARAVALLGRASEKDCRGIAEAVANDPNLDVLRAREDFQKLAKQWQGKQE